MVVMIVVFVRDGMWGGSDGEVQCKVVVVVGNVIWCWCWWGQCNMVVVGGKRNRVVVVV